MKKNTQFIQTRACVYAINIKIQKKNLQYSSHIHEHEDILSFFFFLIHWCIIIMTFENNKSQAIKQKSNHIIITCVQKKNNVSSHPIIHSSHPIHHRWYGRFQEKIPDIILEYNFFIRNIFPIKKQTNTEYEQIYKDVYPVWEKIIL